MSQSPSTQSQPQSPSQRAPTKKRKRVDYDAELLPLQAWLSSCLLHKASKDPQWRQSWRPVTRRSPGSSLSRSSHTTLSNSALHCATTSSEKRQLQTSSHYSTHIEPMLTPRWPRGFHILLLVPWVDVNSPKKLERHRNL